MAAEYEVNIKINSQQVERQLQDIDKIVSNIGKPKGGGSRRKLGLAGLLPSSADLKAAERGLVQLNAKTKAVQSIQDKFSERRLRSLNRSNTLNEKELRLNKQLTAEARARLRLLSQTGAKGFDGTKPQGRQLANDINARVKAQDKRARLLNKINEMEAKGLNVEKLRKQLSKATTEQSARRFASADKEFNLLRKTIELEQAKLRILKEQRRNFPSSPIRGTATMMGSPAQIAASGRQIASPIGGGLGFPGSPGFLAGATASRTPFGLSFPTGGVALPVKGSITMPGSPIAVQAAKKTNLRALKVESSWAKALGQLQVTAGVLKSRDVKVKQSWNVALGTLQETAKLIKVRSQQAAGGLTGQSSPIGGAGNIPGSPAALKGGRRRKKLEQVALGAGFPLLFGGGAGSVLGGAAGGLTGSFGAQIGLSALGQQADQLLASTVKTAESVNSVGGALDFLRERSLFSSKETEELAKKLENQGDLTGIAALVTEELNDALGPGGIQKMQDLAEQTKLAKQQWGELTTNLELLISGPLAEFLKIVNATLGIKVAQSQFARSLSALKGKDPERLGKMLPSFEGSKSKNRVAQIASNLAFGPNTAGGIFDMQGVPENSLISFTEQMNSILKGMGTSDGNIPITEEDKKRFKPGSDMKKAAREEERLQKRLAKLEEERQKIIEISRFKDKIAAAEALGDDQLVIRLQGEQKMAEIEASRKQELVGITDQRLIDSINIGKTTEKLAAQRETERQITEEQRQRQELFQDTVADLEHQLALAQATSEAERERLRIEKKLQELREDGMSEGQIGQVGNLLKQISAENSPLNQFINQSVESLNNLEAHAVQVSQGIGNAIGNSLVSGMQGLITGATSVKQVFADMLKSIADVLAQQASQMIATYIAIGIARAFAGMGTKGDVVQPNVIQSGAGFGLGSEIQVGGAASLFAAEGAYVTGPTNAVVGEGGEPEYIIPQSKMRESMSRYSRGSRGGGVIPSDGGSSASGDGGVAVAAPIDVRYTVERINSVDYVTADQFQSGMQRAASQGAQRGEQNTLKRLQMSGSTRRRLGM